MSECPPVGPSNNWILIQFAVRRPSLSVRHARQLWGSSVEAFLIFNNHLAELFYQLASGHRELPAGIDAQVFLIFNQCPFRLLEPQENVSGQQMSRSEEHTSELQSRLHLVCRLLLEKKKRKEQHRDA